MSSSGRKNVRWEDKDKRSGSSRASTAGGSSSGSSYSEYSDHRYNIAALEETLRITINELDEWKIKARQAEEQLRKHEKEHKGRLSGLEQRVETLEDDNKDLEKSNKTLRDENKDLKEKCAKLQKKVAKLEAKSDSPSSPDTGKPRRHESNSPKESDSDRHNDRLKARFNRSPESTTSESSSSKPPSSSRATRGSRRPSTSITERPPYFEDWGPPGPTAAAQTSPVSPSARRAGNYITTNYPPIATAPIPSPTAATTPRSQRPTVEFTTYANVPVYPEDGNYHAYPLPPEMRKKQH